uniref:Uncharacterized protein n=1 Tax=Euplotes crassus TaxID=5936 RepID=A0A7S3KFK2_EUPCR|mmetsp:Transcript_25048/g.24785  ORF Transcript_25048/g.24785 Transcript_25048/m.24785 type:complete len:163 (+) Transcript_25048:317-805(+)|eukprot:CAMPEP_0196994330 /NCGR_PEP_ID=MMETSP1380-20130617/635_1 /TAXON_ID=5936 /ORGANISM="Euplotes crassus, Strain CT5" /LENGTH=162 /DNA_ID=CAMNT_0042409671 /DNA_START=303 /DNA_END=791 /DNA_ORIENTATION=+
MDTFSDGELTDNSEEDFCGTRSVLAGGCGFEGYNTPTTTFLPITTTKIDDESAAQQQTLFHNNNSINIIETTEEDNERARARARARRDLTDEEFSFKFCKQEKAKPRLPEVGLLQGSGLGSSSPISHHVVHVEEHKDEDCDCMYAAASGMYQAQYMQQQNSF